MEIKLFEFCDFTLDQSLLDSDILFEFQSPHQHNGTVFKRFEFDSDVQRMSVIVQGGCVGRPRDSSFAVYSKGSPEIMIKIMQPSTVPSNYFDKLKEYASRGFRVLAIASRRIQEPNFANIKSMKREQIESDLIFNGFEIFENKLKPATFAAIRALKEAEIGCVMITGDNPLTGSNIGFKSRISDLNKMTIIVDYQGDKFTKEDFVFKNEGARDEPETHLQKTSENNLHTTSEIILLPKKVETNFAATGIDEYVRELLEEAASSRRIQYTMTGAAFNKIYTGDVHELSHEKKELIKFCSVFARAKPNDKAKVVSIFQELGMTVSMCGDGANDCGALKQADVGLSLSPAEASISAPFTANITDISSMVELIKECRAGLATNFSLFNIMAIYSLIQYSTTVISQIYYAYPADLQYLYWDLGCNFFFFMTFGYTGTADKLDRLRPRCSLFTVTNIAQMLMMFFLQLAGQIIMISLISGPYSSSIDYFNNGGLDKNLVRYRDETDFLLDTPEASVLFLFTNFMYISSLLAFTIASPWRKQFFTNIPFMIVLTLCLTYTILICLVPATRLGKFQVTFMDDFEFNKIVLGVALGMSGIMYLNQKLLMEPISNWLSAKYPDNKWL